MSFPKRASETRGESKGPFKDESKALASGVSTGPKLPILFPELGSQALERLRVYQEELIKFNKAINLISASTLPRIEITHFADSILAAKLIHPALFPKKDIYDFGSGNGFPGLVMAVMFSDYQFHLLDRDSRKGEFLKHIISKLELKNVKVLIQDVEDLPSGQVFNAVSRGFAALHKTMLLARKSMPKGGRFFHLKGDAFASELAGVPSQLFTHWSAALLGNYTLPETNSVGAVVLTEKSTD